MCLQKSSDGTEFISGKDIKNKNHITSLYITENLYLYIYKYKMFLPEAFKIIIYSL